MYQKKIPLQLDCGLHLFKELLNGKWKLMLIYYISQDFKRPSELKRKIVNADRRVMNQQLKELELHGFIQKKTYDSKIQKVEYEITPLGESLLPLITELEKWGEDNRIELESAIQRDLKFGNVIP